VEGEVVVAEGEVVVGEVAAGVVAEVAGEADAVDIPVLATPDVSAPVVLAMLPIIIPVVH
jgi:hypothetical protein